MNKVQKGIAIFVLTYLGIGVIVASLVSYIARGWIDVERGFFISVMLRWPESVWPLQDFLGLLGVLFK